MLLLAFTSINVYAYDNFFMSLVFIMCLSGFDAYGDVLYTYSSPNSGSIEIIEIIQNILTALLHIEIAKIRA